MKGKEPRCKNKKPTCCLTGCSKNAVKEFKLTAQHALLQEKLEQMDRDCENMFSANEQMFAAECFAYIRDVNRREEAHVYRSAFRDCTALLRWMGVLA